MYWISCCPHTDQILPKLPAQQKGWAHLACMKVNLSLCVTKCQAMKICPVLNWTPHHEDIWGSGVIAPRLNVGARGRWMFGFTHGRFTPGETVSSNPLIGGWMAPRAGLNFLAEKKESLHVLRIEFQLSRPWLSHYTDRPTLGTLSVKIDRWNDIG
jgi:hypothetical protein